MPVPSHGTAEHPLCASLSRSREGPRAGSSAHPHRRSQRASGTCGTNRRSRGPCGRPRSSRQLPPNSVSDLNGVRKEQRVSVSVSWRRWTRHVIRLPIRHGARLTRRCETAPRWRSARSRQPCGESDCVSRWPKTWRNS